MQLTSETCIDTKHSYAVIRVTIKITSCFGGVVTALLTGVLLLFLNVLFLILVIVLSLNERDVLNKRQQQEFTVQPLLNGHPLGNG